MKKKMNPGRYEFGIHVAIPRYLESTSFSSSLVSSSAETTNKGTSVSVRWEDRRGNLGAELPREESPEKESEEEIPSSENKMQRRVSGIPALFKSIRRKNRKESK